MKTSMLSISSICLLLLYRRIDLWLVRYRRPCSIYLVLVTIINGHSAILTLFRNSSCNLSFQNIATTKQIKSPSLACRWARPAMLRLATEDQQFPVVWVETATQLHSRSLSSARTPSTLLSTPYSHLTTYRKPTWCWTSLTSSTPMNPAALRPPKSTMRVV